jgi:fructose-1,6-bisphosphatase/inositol monophosphatase family enzyme
MYSCYTARGVFDAYYEVGVHSWDIAAASLILEEAGGVLADPIEGDFGLTKRRILCTNPKLLPSLLKLLHNK